MFAFDSTIILLFCKALEFKWPDNFLRNCLKSTLMLLYEQYKQTKPSSNIDYFGTIEMVVLNACQRVRFWLRCFMVGCWGWFKGLHRLFNNLAALHKNKVNFESPLSSSVQGSRQSQQGLKVLVVALSYCYFNIIELSTVYRFTYILGVLTQTLRSLI